MNKLYMFLSTFFLLISLTGLSQAEQFTVLPSGLEYKDLTIGRGEEAQLGDTAVIHFVGWLYDNEQPGKEIYNSRKEGKLVSFVIGTRNVLQGWNEGVVGMLPGGTRMLRIPPELGYGVKGVEGLVPPDSSLLFIIQLLELRKSN